MSIERDAKYYNEIYSESESYSKHYSESRYYKLWTNVIELIPAKSNVVEIGCGTGQFAAMLYEADLVETYHGYDISETAIEMAKKSCGNFFHAIDCYLLTIPATKLIICLETLEHIDDVKFLNLLAMGSEIVFTVPDFDDPAHVRYFKNVAEIVFRFHQKIDFTHIVKIEKWFLCKGKII